MRIQRKNGLSMNNLITVLQVLVISFATVTAVYAGLRENVVLKSNSIRVNSGEAYTFLQLRVVDPDGLVLCTLTSNGQPLIWTVSENSANGLYAYEVIAGRERAKSSDKVDNNQRGLGKKKRAEKASGNFQVKDGVIILQGKEVGLFDHIASIGLYAVNSVMDFLVSSAYADVQHLDDVIITFSLCVGNDCVNGESFGFDTVRIKENNVRVHFNDTSNSASFPANDWRLVINDSTNGGSNYFAVEDSSAGRQVFRVDAGAPANSLYVDSGGDVGLGTSTPVVDLHIASGNTPTLRLEQNGSSGFTAQTWDIAGNEANFFVRDVTNSSNLPFKIKPGAPTSALFIAADGDIGLGVESPEAALDIRVPEPVDGANPETVFRVSKGNGDAGRLFTVSDAGNAYLLGNLELGSSRSLKENIHSLNSAEAEKALAQLQPVHFNYRHSPNIRSLGFIAEDVPDLVAVSGRNSVRPMDIITVLTKVTQEQQREIADLHETVSNLQEQLNVQ